MLSHLRQFTARLAQFASQLFIVMCKPLVLEGEIHLQRSILIR